MQYKKVLIQGVVDGAVAVVTAFATGYVGLAQPYSFAAIFVATIVANVVIAKVLKI